MKKRILTILLTLVLSMSFVPLIDGVGNVYAAGNPYSGGNSNCTWTAWQQAKDNTGVELPGWGNAGTWYNSAINAGYSVGGTPRAKSIAVYSGNPGHVAYVADYNSGTNQIYVKEGGYLGGYHEGWTPVQPSYNGGLLGFIYLNGGGAPTNAWIRIDKTEVMSGQSATFSFGADNSNGYYTIGIDREGKRIITEGINGKNSYTISFSEPGSYSAYVTCYSNTTYVDTNRVYFTVTSADYGNDFYGKILNTKLWKTISYNPSTHKITLETENTEAYQQWHFVRQSDGTYAILSCYDGYALEMTDGIQEGGTQLSAHPYWEGAYQKWYLMFQGNGVVIQSKHYTNDNWVMDLRGGSSADGTSIDIYARHNGDNQIFSVYKGNDIQLAGVQLNANVSNDKRKVTFTFDKNDAHGARNFALKIWKDKLWEGDAYLIDSDVKSGCSVHLDNGTYYAYVDSCDFFHFEKSNVIEIRMNHKHAIVKVPGKAPTTTTEGNSEYWTCTGCGKCFSDSDGKTEISKESMVIPRLSPSEADSSYSKKTDLPAIKISGVKSAKKAAVVKWKKISRKNRKKIAKIQIQYSRDKNFKKGVKKKIVSAKKTSYKIKGLKSKKKYYVRVRAYTKTGTTKHVSKWSGTKTVRTK